MEILEHAPLILGIAMGLAFLLGLPFVILNWKQSKRLSLVGVIIDRPNNSTWIFQQSRLWHVGQTVGGFLGFTFFFGILLSNDNFRKKLLSLSSESIGPAVMVVIPLMLVPVFLFSAGRSARVATKGDSVTFDGKTRRIIISEKPVIPFSNIKEIVVARSRIRQRSGGYSSWFSLYVELNIGPKVEIGSTDSGKTAAVIAKGLSDLIGLPSKTVICNEDA